jgi:hypothetical protein
MKMKNPLRFMTWNWSLQKGALATLDHSPYEKSLFDPVGVE